MESTETSCLKAIADTGGYLSRKRRLSVLETVLQDELRYIPWRSARTIAGYELRTNLFI